MSNELSMTSNTDYSCPDYLFQGNLCLSLFLSVPLIRNNNKNEPGLRPQRSASQSRSVSRSTAGFEERASPLERDQRSRGEISDKDTCVTVHYLENRRIQYCRPPRRQAPTISRRVVDELKNRIIGESRLMNLGRSREVSNRSFAKYGEKFQFQSFWNLRKRKKIFFCFFDDFQTIWNGLVVNENLKKWKTWRKKIFFWFFMVHPKCAIRDLLIHS